MSLMGQSLALAPRIHVGTNAGRGGGLARGRAAGDRWRRPGGGGPARGQVAYAEGRRRSEFGRRLALAGQVDRQAQQEGLEIGADQGRDAGIALCLRCGGQASLQEQAGPGDTRAQALHRDRAIQRDLQVEDLLGGGARGRQNAAGL